MKYDVIIIGAGPGGIFAAYELMKKKPDCKIAVFEEGYPLEKRKCSENGHQQPYYHAISSIGLLHILQLPMNQQ